MIEITDKTYMKTVWVFDIKHTASWFAFLIKHEGKDFEGVQSFRYYIKGEPYDVKERWFGTYGAREKLSETEIEEFFDNIANDIGKAFCNKVQKLEINEYGKKACEILLKNQWFKTSNPTEWEDEVNNIIH